MKIIESNVKRKRTVIDLLTEGAYLKAGIEYLMRSVNKLAGTGVSDGQVAFNKMPSNADDFIIYGNCERRGKKDLLPNLCSTIHLLISTLSRFSQCLQSLTK